MADIAKCNDSLCPSKDYCYRFTAHTSPMYQSWGSFNRATDADNCDMFYANSKCRHCNLENDNHKMSCPIMKIQVNL
jgi:hypothetical protein